MALLSVAEPRCLLRRLPGAVRHIGAWSNAGETVAIIGSNGAGKSTFLKTITGMLPAAREAIRFDGEPIGGLPAPDIMKRGIAMVPEGRRLFPSLSRRGEPADRRLRPRRLRPLVAEDALRAVPDPRRTPQQPVDRAVRRPAADGGDRPRADVQPETAALRRDLARPRAGGHPRHLRRAPGDQGRGHRDRRRRAGHRPGDEGLGPRLLLLGGPHDAGRRAGRRCRARQIHAAYFGH